MQNGLITIAHLSDLHLGYRSGSKMTSHGVNWREMDGYMAFHRVVNQIIKDGTIDVVLIAGDVFHTPQPSIMTIYMAQKEIRRLSEAGMRVYILTGNHDVSDVKTEMAATAVLNDPDKNIWAHWEPYVRHEIAPGVLLHMVSHHLYQDQGRTWDAMRPEPGAINIFTAHGSIVDPITKLQLHTEGAPREIVIPDEIVEGRDWTARLLGHIHERGFVGSKDGVHDTAGLKTYYNGSLIRRGFSDADDALGRGWTKWTVMPDGTLIPEFHKIAQRPQVAFPVIDAEDMSASDVTDLVMDNLKSSIADDDSDDEDASKRWSKAPILGQKIINITPEKKRALDTKAINKEASKALAWSFSIKSHQDEGKTSEKLGQPVAGGSLDEQFSNWLKDSDEYNRLHKSIKEKVADETMRFIKLSEDEVLDHE